MTDQILGYKLLISYEVKEETMQDYYQFVMGRYMPELQAAGLQMSEAWQTAYGNGPSRLMGFVCEDQATMIAFLESEPWFSLTEQFQTFVTDLSYKVIPYRGGFQL